MPDARLHDGTTTEVRIHGTGPTVLMLPLAGQSNPPAEVRRLKTALHRALVDELSGGYRLVFFDYPGRHPKPGTLTPANVVADLLAVADAAGADEFAWCGYSWTAIIGLQLALHTDRLNGLICGGWPPLDGPYERMLQTLYARPGADTEPELRQIITYYEGLRAFDDRTTRLSCPRLCFAGTADDIYDLGIGRTVAGRQAELRNTGWDVSLLDGHDHMTALEPETFVPVITTWLDTSLRG
jgi:pimeloyl-ACP methyl ester carboxylesterase